MTMQLVGWAIIHSLWQGGAIALVIACLFALTRDTRASVRYAIGLAGLTLMLVLPVATAIDMSGNHDTGSETPAITTGTLSRSPSGSVTRSASASREPSLIAHPAPPNTPSAVLPEPSGISAAIDRYVVRYIEIALPWLALAWMLGLVVASAQLIGGLSRTRRITRVGTSSPSDGLVERVRVLSERLGISRAIRVLQSVSVDVPLVVGALRPVIVVPASLLTGLTPLQLDMLLAHELAHVRRYDFFVNLVQTVIETLLFYHPAVRWLSDRVREEREDCCDDIAVSLCGGDASGYTATLLALEESRTEGFGLAAAATGGSLLRRAHRLITGRSPHVELGPRWIAGVITIAAALFTGREAMGSGIEASFAPLPGIHRTDDADSIGKRDRIPDPARAAPASVAKSPIGGRLDERRRWADARGRGLGSYWVGYLVAGDPNGKARYYADEIPIRVDQTTTISGHMQLGDGDLSGITFYGMPLAPITGAHAPRSTAIFVLFNNGVLGKRIERVHVGSFDIPMYFDRRPVMWLDSASDAESLDLIRTLMPKARGEDVRRDMVAALGVHQTLALVVPQLIDVLQSKSEPEGVRREAVEWLGNKGDARAIAALSRAARTDRSKGVREEAIEAFAHMPARSATDSLIAFASTLGDYDYSRTAIEALGHRDDSRALGYLTRVVRTSGQDQLRVDALEAIADMPDGRGLQTVMNFARTDPDADIRRKAVESIARSVPPARALDVLMQVVRSDPDESVRREAVETIAEVHDVNSVGNLRDLANNAASLVLQVEAVESLGETVDPESALKVLGSIVRNHPSAEVRKKALETLGDFHDEPARALTLLKSVIENEKDSDVRLHAVEALAELNDDAGIPWLRELARSSRDAAVRNRAQEVLNER